MELLGARDERQVRWDVAGVISGGMATTLAMLGSTEEEQFEG